MNESNLRLSNVQQKAIKAKELESEYRKAMEVK